MFEILVSLCLDAVTCRDRLIPTDAPDCASALTQAELRLAVWADILGSEPICIPTPPTDMAFDRIAPGLHVHRGLVEDVTPDNAGDIANVVIVEGGDSVAVIDTGGSRAVGERIYTAVRAITDKPISHVILTHTHPDHIYGASALADAGAIVVGHAKLTDALAARADTYSSNMERLMGSAFLGSAIPSIEKAIAARTQIDLGNRILQLDPWPLAHTSTDLTVFDKSSGTLIAGDLLFDRHTPVIDGSLLGWEAVMVQLDALDPVRVIPGHGGPVLPWPEGAAPQSAYFNVLKAEARIAIETGTGLAEAAETIGRSQADRWALFDLFNPRNATVAFTELEWE